MARINPAKMRQEADKAEKAGRFDQAIAMYRQIVDDNPQDWNTINKIGDLFAKLNRNHEAAGEYAKVADYYARDGFVLKAIAIWKKINKLDSTALEPYLNLAELYARQGLLMEAKSQYQIIVEEFVKRGKLRDAGETLRKMAEIDPGDLKIRSKLADLYIREGNTQQAIEEHIAIADELNKKGHLAESLQVLEKGLKIAPHDSRLRVELGRIHLLQKNYEKAVQTLEDAARQSPNDVDILNRLGEAYLGARRIDEAQAVLAHLIRIDPSRQDARIQMGRVHLIQGQFDQAYAEFAPIVDTLLERQESDQAIALLQQVVQRNPTHINSLLKLAEVFRSIGKESFVTATYSQLTEAYIKLNQFEQAASILDMLVSMEPQNQQFKTKLAFVRQKQAAPSPRAASMPMPSEFEEEEEFDLDQPLTMGAPTTPMGGVFGAAAPAASLSMEDKEYVDEHLAEGRVFRKYGLVDRAIDQFEAVVQRFPDNIDARRELCEIFKEKGLADRTTEQLQALAKILRMRGETAESQALLEEAARLRPQAAPVRRPTAPKPAPAPRVAPPAVAPPPAAPPSAPVFEEEISFDEEAPLLESLGVPEEAPAPIEEEIPLEIEEPGEVPPIAAESLLSDLGLEGEEALPERFIEEPPPSMGAPQYASEVPTAQEPPVEIGNDLFGSLGGAPEAPAAELDVLDLGAGPEVYAPEPATGALPWDLERAMSEVDQFVALGFAEDAKEALRSVGMRYPGHPAILEKIAELGLDEEVAPQAPYPPSPPAYAAAPVTDFSSFGETLDALTDYHAPEEPSFGEGIDLGAELGDLFTTQAAVEEPAPAMRVPDMGDVGLAEIFKEFKKGVDRQLGQEDYDTRYNLGIAYKEMGLIDEAIAEFQLAVKDESRLLECSSMLGLCFLEKGIPKLAIKWFERGLSAPNRRPEEYQGLRYDLATAYEATGETQKAYGLYLELYSQEASFRDVAVKVQQLGAHS